MLQLKHSGSSTRSHLVTAAAALRKMHHYAHGAALPKSALLCLLPGLGDAFTASPLLRKLPSLGYNVDVLAMLSPVGHYARALDLVRNTYVLPLLERPERALRALRQLRAQEYDLVIVPFPAARWQYALVARLVATKTLLMHDYGGSSRAIAGMGRHILVSLRGGHRVAENGRLVEAIGGAASISSYVIPVKWRRPRIADLLGVHPGSMIYKGNDARRWPADAFIELVKRQVCVGRRVRIFLGPNELGFGDALGELLTDSRVELIARPLDEAAGLVSECEVFVGNDAGFTHLASAMGVNTIALFGMTDPIRAQPLGHSIALRPSLCPPCHDEGRRGFECIRHLAFQCITRDLTVDAVVSAVSRAFTEGLPEMIPLESGPYSLYGKPRHG